MNEPTPSPSPRSTAFYISSGVSAVGFLLFISVFFSFALNFGNFDHFDENGRSMMLCAVTGMTMMIAGGLISGFGTARRFGPLIQNHLEDAARQLSTPTDPSPPRPIHCPYCNTDNDPSLMACQNCGAALAHQRHCTGCGRVAEADAKFCNHCGKAI